jgi:hypothetical protein
MTKEVTLSANDKPVPVDYFVQSFLDHTARGMLASLHGIEEIKTSEFIITGEKASIRLNGEPLPANPFVQKIIASVIVAMTSCLKMVDGTDRIKLTLKE